MLSQMQTFEQPDFHSIAEVADLLSERLGRRIRSGSIRYLITSGRVSDVVRAGGKRVFTDRDIDRIQEALEEAGRGRAR